MKHQTSYKHLFKEYPFLSLVKLNLIKSQIDKLFDQRRFTLASSVCSEWTNHVIQALIYFHRYERSWLLCFIVATYLTWSLYILCKYSLNLTIQRQIGGKFQWFTLTLILGLSFFLFTTHQPWRYYFYCFTPVYILHKLFGFVSVNNINITCWNMVRFFGILITIELFTLCFDDRRILSLILSISALVYYFKCRKRENTFDLVTVTFNTVILAVFPLLPTIGRDSSVVLVTLACILASCQILFQHSLFGNMEFYRYVALASLFLAYIVRITVHVTRVPILSCFLSWFLLILCLTVVYDFRRKSAILDFQSVYLMLFPVYILMSTYYEPLFYLCFCFLLNSTKSIDSDWSLARKSTITVFLTLLAFFGTGNLASLNSFDPNFVKTFVTVFSPFLMTSLLLLKVCLPIFMVSFSLVMKQDGRSQVSWTILAISDIMALVYK